MRFSLRSFLLVLFVLALAASHFYTSWKLNGARREILMLRTELGFLTIIDPDRLNLIQTPKEGWHSWRVYVPPGAHYKLRGAAAQIPATGHPHAGQTEIIDVDLPEGEFTLKARVERLQDEWTLKVECGRGQGVMIGVRDEEMRNWAGSTQGGTEWVTMRGAKGVETFGRNESFDLIREHEWKVKGAAPFRPPGPKPSYGLLLWLEAQ